MFIATTACHYSSERQRGNRDGCAPVAIASGTDLIRNLGDSTKKALDENSQPLYYIGTRYISR